MIFFIKILIDTTNTQPQYPVQINKTTHI